MVDAINAMSPEELKRITVEELGEDENKMKQDLEAIKAWIKKSPHLQNIRKDDIFLKGFLRGCKYSLERTKEKLDFFFTVRGTLPEWFGDWNPQHANVQTFINTGVIYPLRGYDKKGRYTVITRPGSLDPSVMKIDDIIKCNMMIMEFALRDNIQAQVNGVVIVQDMSGLTVQHAAQVSISFAKKLITVFQEAYPTSPKAFHVLNMPGVMESIHNMMQSFQKKKMRERQHIHPKGDLTKLHEELGTDILPKEYGGTNGTLEDHRVFWKAELENNADWIKQQSTYKSEESKRPGKPKLHADIFGIEGSFRKLEID